MKTPLNTFYFFAFLLALALIDFNIVHYGILQGRRLKLAFETLVFRLKLEKEIYMIRFNKKKYLRMANEILKDLESNEAK